MTQKKIHYSKIDELFFAISSPLRRDLLFKIASQDWTVQQLAKRYQISRVAVLGHLNCIDRADLLFKRRKNRKIYYGLDPAPLKKIMEVINQFQSTWLDQVFRLAEKAAHSRANAEKSKGSEANKSPNQ
jgi:predicted transcriptional regulator